MQCMKGPRAKGTTSDFEHRPCDQGWGLGFVLGFRVMSGFRVSVGARSLEGLAHLVLQHVDPAVLYYGAVI